MKTVKIAAVVIALLLVSVLSALPAAGDSYAVHINPMDHGTVTAAPASAAPGERVFLTVAPEAGYMLTELEVLYSMRDRAALDPDNSFLMPADEVVVNATFEAIPAGTCQLITTVQGGHGRVSASRYGVAAGETETIVFMPDEGYDIDKVTVNGKEFGVMANVLDVVVTADTEVVVTYAPALGDPYAVHINPMDHGTVTAAPASAAPGERVFLTVAPEAGYMPTELEVLYSMRDRVSLDPDNSFIMPADDVVVNATFEAIPAGTCRLITAVQGGHGRVSASRYGVAAGETETIIFMPDDGYEIDKVTVNGKETGVLANVLDVTVTADTELVVTYKQVSAGDPTDPAPTDPTPTDGTTAPTNGGQPTAPTDAGTSQSTGGWMMWVIIGLSAAVVALAVALILIMRKK